jgi:hypothetical protein
MFPWHPPEEEEKGRGWAEDDLDPRGRICCIPPAWLSRHVCRDFAMGLSIGIGLFITFPRRQRPGKQSLQRRHLIYLNFPEAKYGGAHLKSQLFSRQK